MHQTIRVNPTWSKGYARKGAALHGEKRWNEAIATYEQGLKLEGDNPSPALLKGLKEVQEAQSKSQS
jgi:stress-induced-phosphoprotein 1